MYNDRKQTDPVRFDYVPEPPLWIVIVRFVAELVAKGLILTAIVLFITACLILLPQLW
jgi:hypothetical protein